LKHPELSCVATLAELGQVWLRINLDFFLAREAALDRLPLLLPPLQEGPYAIVQDKADPVVDALLAQPQATSEKTVDGQNKARAPIGRGSGAEMQWDCEPEIIGDVPAAG
jgi:hypothetical protein